MGVPYLFPTKAYFDYQNVAESQQGRKGKLVSSWRCWLYHQRAAIRLWGAGQRDYEHGLASVPLTASPRTQPLTTSKHRSDHTDLSPWLLHGSYSDWMGQAVLDNLCPHCRFKRKGTFQLVFGGWGAYCKAIEYWNTTNSFEFPSMPFCLYLPPTSPTITYTFIIPNCLAFWSLVFICA